MLRAQYPGSSNEEDINDLENQLSKLLANKEYLELPVIKEFAERAKDKVAEMNTLLLNDKTYLNQEGLNLVHERDLWAEILSAFGMDHANEAISFIEKYIDSKITEEPNA